MRTGPAPFTLSINAPKPSWNFLQQVLTDARVALCILRFVRRLVVVSARRAYLRPAAGMESAEGSHLSSRRRTAADESFCCEPLLRSVFINDASIAGPSAVLEFLDVSNEIVGLGNWDDAKTSTADAGNPRSLTTRFCPLIALLPWANIGRRSLNRSDCDCLCGFSSPLMSPWLLKRTSQQDSWSESGSSC
jgi:hypothetical protein